MRTRVLTFPALRAPALRLLQSCDRLQRVAHGDGVTLADRWLVVLAAQAFQLLFELRWASQRLYLVLSQAESAACWDIEDGLRIDT